MSTVIDIIICIITLSHVKEMAVYVTNSIVLQNYSAHKYYTVITRVYNGDNYVYCNFVQVAV